MNDEDAALQAAIEALVPRPCPLTVEEVAEEEARQAADPNPPQLPESLRDPLAWGPIRTKYRIGPRGRFRTLGVKA